MPCLKQEFKWTNESENNKTDQGEVKLTKFNLSQTKDDGNNTVHHQDEPVTKPVETNEPQIEAEL